MGCRTQGCPFPSQILCPSRGRAVWVPDSPRVSFAVWLGMDNSSIGGRVSWLSIDHKDSLVCFRQIGLRLPGEQCWLGAKHAGAAHEAGPKPTGAPQFYMFCCLKTSMWQKTALVVTVRLHIVDATSLSL